MENKIKVLAIGDGVTPTGFSRVMHSIFGRLANKENYEIHHLAVNYYGDPHNYNYRIYPAAIGGDVYGINRLKNFTGKVDIIFILNDLWIINEYLKEIKKTFNPIPKIVVYFPVDAENLDPVWFSNFDIVSQSVVYTKFGFNCVLEANEDIKARIITHGVDTNTFYKLPESKEELKKGVYPDREDFKDSFIVLNANRNQPRKRIDIAVEAFSLFAENKPENVKYYHHAGLTDVGWDIRRVAKYYGIEKRLVLTNLNTGVQSVSDEKLNMIYNTTDVGITSTTGEGFGLTSVEHAMTGAPQIVPGHSACKELFFDCGVVVPAHIKIAFEKTTTVGRLALAGDLAEALGNLYTNHRYYDALSLAGIRKFGNETFSWDKITDLWDELFQGVMNDYYNLSEYDYQRDQCNKKRDRKADNTPDSSISDPV
jgi:glycosyltransferase involved in cell wall biosynthesis